MNRFALALLLATASLFVSPCAQADSTTTADIQRVPVIVIYGRAAKPAVGIVVKTPTAAEAAGAAHETFRASLLARAAPVGLSHGPAAP